MDMAGFDFCLGFWFFHTFILLSWFQNAPFWPISALGENFNPRNIPYIPPVEIFIRLDLYQTET
ncbi:MAG: hypothetical protein WA151_11450, partial [Desulfatirhabdiaceae bacterium]